MLHLRASIGCVPETVSWRFNLPRRRQTGCGLVLDLAKCLSKVDSGSQIDSKFRRLGIGFRPEPLNSPSLILKSI